MESRLLDASMEDGNLHTCGDGEQIAMAMVTGGTCELSLCTALSYLSSLIFTKSL